MFFSKNSPQRWILQILIHIISRSCSIFFSITSFPFIHIISIFIHIISISTQEMIFIWIFSYPHHFHLNIISIFIHIISRSNMDNYGTWSGNDMDKYHFHIISQDHWDHSPCPFPPCFFFFRRIVPQTRRASSSFGAKLRSGHLFGEQLELLAMKPWVGWFTMIYPLVMSK